MRLFIDTGPFMARHNKRDKQHSYAVQSFDKIRDGETLYRKLYTSDYILDEAVTACRQRTRNHGLPVGLGTLILSSESLLMLRDTAQSDRLYFCNTREKTWNNRRLQL